MRALTLTLALFALSAAGCSSQQYGECQAPDDHLKVMFKPKNVANPLSHSFCIVCNPDLSSEEHAAWALEMGAPKEPGDPEDMLPCLYVYPPENAGGNGANSLKQCMSWICEGGATYSDLVSDKNGNFDLEKLLNGEIDTSLEVLTNSSETLSLPEHDKRTIEITPAEMHNAR